MHDFCDKPYLLLYAFTFDLLQDQICCQVGDHNISNLLVLMQMTILYC